MTFDPRYQQPQQQPYQGQWPPPQQQQPQYQPQYQQQPQYQVQPYQQPYPPQSPYAPPGMTIAPKSPGVALLISFFLPGVGSMYAGSVGLGVIILVLWLISVATVFILIGWILAPACWIWGMIAACMNAQRWNRERGIIS